MAVCIKCGKYMALDEASYGATAQICVFPFVGSSLSDSKEDANKITELATPSAAEQQRGLPN